VQAEPRSGYVYIDKTGAVVIKGPFSVAREFSEGLARVMVGGKDGFIDKSGTLVIPAQFDDAKPFSEGLAAVGFKVDAPKPDKK
jgi:hypothetical protein